MPLLRAAGLSIITALAVSVGAPPPLALDRDALYRELLAQEAAEHSNPDHLSFLDRGLASGPFAGDVSEIASRLARPIGLPGATGAAFPRAGVMPTAIDGTALAAMDPAILNACVAVADGDRVRWYGRAPLTTGQYWSSTKILQCFNLASVVNEAHPEVRLGDTRIGGFDSAPAMPLARLMREIVSYEQGVTRSNAGAECIGRFVSRQAREALVEEMTGHDVMFRGGYGAGSLFERPQLTGAGGAIVAIGPAAIGEIGPNLVSAYDLTRVVAMAAWHPHLSPEQRITGAQWHSLSAVLLAMGHDSARYLDIAFQKLGLVNQVRDVTIATKLGFGFSSASGLAQLTYTGTLRFSDTRHVPPVTRRACFTLRGEAASAVALDARVALEVTDLLRLLANGAL